MKTRCQRNAPAATMGWEKTRDTQLYKLLLSNSVKPLRFDTRSSRKREVADRLAVQKYIRIHSTKIQGLLLST